MNGQRTADGGPRTPGSEPGWVARTVRYPLSAVRLVTDFGENVGVALGALRVAKMRSALTILGVVIACRA